ETSLSLIAMCAVSPADQRQSTSGTAREEGERRSIQHLISPTGLSLFHGQINWGFPYVPGTARVTWRPEMCLAIPARCRNAGTGEQAGSRLPANWTPSHRSTVDRSQLGVFER